MRGDELGTGVVSSKCDPSNKLRVELSQSVSKAAAVSTPFYPRAAHTKAQ